MAKGILAGLGQKLKRLFLGRIIVHSIGRSDRAAPPKITTHARDLETFPVRTTPRVGAALFMQWKHTAPNTAGPVIGADLSHNLVVKGADLSVPDGVEVHRYDMRLNKKCVAKNGRRAIASIPHSRRNRVSFLKNPPRFAQSSLLAFYSPLYHDKVTKSALDKASGRLLFWYDDKIALGAKSHLLLFRVFQGGEPLKWVWLDADKKIGQ